MKQTLSKQLIPTGFMFLQIAAVSGMFADTQDLDAMAEDAPHDYHSSIPAHANQYETSSSVRYLAEAGESKPWGAMIGFTLVVNLATLSGVVFLIPVISRNARTWVRSFFWDKAIPSPDDTREAHVSNDQKESEEEEHIGGNFIDISIPSFAGGALIATAIFLVIPESLYLIQSHLTAHSEEAHVHRTMRLLEEVHDEHEGEASPDAVWRFGASLLGGFMLPMVFDALFPRYKKHFEGDKCTTQENFDEDVEHAEQAKVTHAKTINYGLAASIILGDAFHNFCDGVFVGVALTLCDRTTAYTIVAVTLYHEIAQELADYFLLTKHAGLRPLKALILNFVAGLSVMFGGITVLAAPVSDMIIGVILSIASGVYLYISCCECLPRVAEVVESRSQRVLSMGMFILGVVPISLTLLNHQHCDAEGHADDGHEGHNH